MHNWAGLINQDIYPRIPSKDSADNAQCRTVTAGGQSTCVAMRQNHRLSSANQPGSMPTYRTTGFYVLLNDGQSPFLHSQSLLFWSSALSGPYVLHLLQRPTQIISLIHISEPTRLRRISYAV